jgi:hypothetical protein
METFAELRVIEIAKNLIIALVLSAGWVLKILL